jgi:succinate dehydrogenase/fumarate reductase flavoprotein subunit
MGKSTLDCMVFGRRAGRHSAEYVKTGVDVGALGLEHVKRYVAELETSAIEHRRRAPLLLPDYRGQAVLARSIDIF